MKQILSILFCLIFVCSYAGKKDSTTVKQDFTHELSLNATFFIKQFINFSGNNNIAISPYALSYKLINAKNNAMRFSIGMDYRSTVDPIEDTPDKVSSTSVNLDYRIGFEHRFDLGKKWMAFVGADITNSLSKNKTTTTSTIINPSPPFNEIEAKILRNDQTVGIGMGPVVGIQINFTPRISLFTESSFLFTQNISKSEVRSTPAFVPESKDKFSSSSMQFILPTSLFFGFKF